MWMILRRTQINTIISHWVDTHKGNINEGHPGIALCAKDTAMRKKKKKRQKPLSHFCASWKR